MTQTSEPPSKDQLDELRELVATGCRIMAQHGIVKGTMGHLSARIPGTNDIMVRGRPPVDPGLRFCDPSSVIRVDSQARPVGATHGVKRVSEIFLHTEVYNRRPEVNAVIHAHAPWSRLCMSCNIPLQMVYFEANPIKMLYDGIPFYERSITLHTKDEADPAMDAMGKADIVLLNRHGVVVAGDSVADAVHRIIELEHIAHNNYLAALAGPVSPIPARDVAEWKERADANAERIRRGLPDDLHPGGSDDDGRGERDGFWTYYLALLNSGALFVNDSGLQ